MSASPSHRNLPRVALYAAIVARNPDGKMRLYPVTDWYNAMEDKAFAVEAAETCRGGGQLIIWPRPEAFRANEV